VVSVLVTIHLLAAAVWVGGSTALVCGGRLVNHPREQHGIARIPLRVLDVLGRT